MLITLFIFQTYFMESCLIMAGKLRKHFLVYADIYALAHMGTLYNLKLIGLDLTFKFKKIFEKQINKQKVILHL